MLSRTIVVIDYGTHSSDAIFLQWSGLPYKKYNAGPLRLKSVTIDRLVLDGDTLSICLSTDDPISRHSPSVKKRADYTNLMISAMSNIVKIIIDELKIAADQLNHDVTIFGIESPIVVFLMTSRVTGGGTTGGGGSGGNW